MNQQLTTQQVLDLLLTWLAQNYPSERVPLGLFKRTLANYPGLRDVRQIDAAARVGVERGFLREQGRSTDGPVLSLLLPGLSRGRALLESIEAKARPGALSEAAEHYIRRLTEEFERALRGTATQWATEVGDVVEPVHVALAAKSLAAGSFAAVLDTVEANRDKSRDGPAEQRLLSALWKT